jgi:hypothetical protein
MLGLVILLALAAFVLKSVFTYNTIRQRREAWHAVVSRLGMHLIEDHAKGEIGGFQVKIHPWLESAKCRVRVWLGETSIETMHAENVKLGLNVASAKYIDTGDHELEANVRLRGRNEEVLALLDVETRRAIPPWVSAGCKIETSMLIMELPLDMEKNLYLERTVLGLVQFAQRVSCPSDQVMSRLGKNAVEDPHPAVRLRCLEALLGEDHDEPEVQNALALAAFDHQPINASIARLAREGARMPEGEMLRLLDSGRETVAFWAARWLGEVGSRDAVEPLIAHQSAKSEEVRGEVLRSLQKIRDRLGQDAALGRLSLSAGSGGELSHAVESGAISLSEKKS